MLSGRELVEAVQSLMGVSEDTRREMLSHCDPHGSLRRLFGRIGHLADQYPCPDDVDVCQYYDWLLRVDLLTRPATTETIRDLTEWTR